MSKKAKQAETPEATPAWIRDLLAAAPPMMSRDQAAEFVGVGRRTLDRAIRARDIEVIKIGSRVVIPRGALVAFLSKNATA